MPAAARRRHRRRHVEGRVEVRGRGRRALRCRAVGVRVGVGATLGQGRTRHGGRPRPGGASCARRTACSSPKRTTGSCVPTAASTSRRAAATTVSSCCPDDADAPARALRARAGELGADVAVIVSDTFGRPWRNGQTDVAIGIAGMSPMQSYIGEVDPHGHEFRVQELCVADELASAAELVKGNTSRIPAAVARGRSWERDDTASMRGVIRDASLDLFR
ncbi:MAG: coenzyme F420-0:L-glutamate ligase [Ilumatobacteraceae bacterium]